MESKDKKLKPRDGFLESRFKNLESRFILSNEYF